MPNLPTRLARLETVLAAGEKKPPAVPYYASMRPAERFAEFLRILDEAEARKARGEPILPRTPEHEAANERLGQMIERALNNAVKGGGDAFREKPAE
jgi:hypothetical protein